MDARPAWQTQFSIETSASPEAIWALFRDVPGWTLWNAGIETIALEGPFAAGTGFVMKPPGEEPLRAVLTEVRENESFVDETRIDDLVIAVTHRIEPLAPSRTRITYAVDARGEGAAEIGPMISADFPDVLAALVAIAEGRRS
ncbi:SRPBCC family protein [Bradyrhizobium erythrophlei]|uniref:SRPBCC family protein n=1 Tax=Bradyrhizobium erythrophlei TaxID=1437360 RepID=UPI0035E8F9CB